MNANIILLRANIHNVTAARIRLGIFRDNILYNILCRAIRWDDTRTHAHTYYSIHNMCILSKCHTGLVVEMWNITEVVE